MNFGHLSDQDDNGEGVVGLDQIVVKVNFVAGTHAMEGPFRCLAFESFLIVVALGNQHFASSKLDVSYTAKGAVPKPVAGILSLDSQTAMLEGR